MSAVHVSIFYDHLLASLACTNEFYRYVRLLLNESNVLLSLFGELLPRGNPLRRSFPSREFLPDYFPRVINPRSDRNHFLRIEDVELGDVPAVEAVDHGAVAEIWDRKPAAAT